MSRLKMYLRKRYAGHKVARDTKLGYPVWRSWFPWEDVQYVAGEENPDLIVVMAIKPVKMALAAQLTGIPIVMQLMDVEFKDHGGAFEELGHIPCIANSVFTAAIYRDTYGVTSEVIYPFIAPNKYKTETTRQNVTFINPVPEKGRDIAIGIARLCPDIPFAFIEGWPLSRDQRNTLLQLLADAPNVTLLPPQEDMRRVYGKCKILLAPSLWAEAYGRVATEAQFSGIPVVASNRGGLPEAVGHGGILVDPNGPLDDWASAVRELWNNPEVYSELATAAQVHSNRSDLEYSMLLNRMEKAFIRLGNQNPIKTR